MNDVPFNDLLGKTLNSVTGKAGDDEMVFTAESGETYRLHHEQDCCESVSIQDICGELKDLVGSPIIQAEENNSTDDPEGFKHEYAPDSCTWTFYRIATAKGQVVIRWKGESNGYYSESVSFEKMD